MSFLSKIQDANQDIVSTSNEVYLMAKPKPTDNLETILTWVQVEGTRINKERESFKSHVEMLMSNNIDFYNWVIEHNQAAISVKMGIAQSYVSQIFGSVKKKHNANQKLQMIKQINEGVAYKKIAEQFGCSEKSVQRAAKMQDADRTKYHSDNLSCTLVDDAPLSTYKEENSPSVNPVKIQLRREILQGRNNEELASIILEQEEKIMILESNIRQKDRDLKEQAQKYQQEINNLKAMNEK